MVKLVAGAVFAAALSAQAVSARPFEDPRADKIEKLDGDAAYAAAPRDPACRATTLASTGGPMPRDPHTLVVRWTGYTNFELVYNGQILLLDAFFDRGHIYPALGFKADDVKKANGILIGHGHFDHMADAASIAARLNIPIVGAPATAEKLATQPVDQSLVRVVTGKGGEGVQIGPFHVEPILGRHGEPPPTLVDAFSVALKRTAKQPTEDEAAEQAGIHQRGSSDRRVITEGTIGYLITLDDGFKIMYRDSGGRVTDYEKAALEKSGPVDLGLVAVAASYLNTLNAEQALEHMRTYRPDVYMPGHHDAARNDLWRATEPLFQAVKDEFPNIVTVSKNYREPTCFNTEVNISKGR